MPANRDKDISEVTAKLNKELLDRLMAQSKEKSIIFSFPQFEIKNETADFSQLLSSMGIYKTFTSPTYGILANNSPVCFALMLQKSSISISHTGLEAASVTAGMEVGSPGTITTHPDEIVFNFSRPFVFLVRENSTGAILYVGQVKSLPQYEGEFF